MYAVGQPDGSRPADANTAPQTLNTTQHSNVNWFPVTDRGAATVLHMRTARPGHNLLTMGLLALMLLSTALTGAAQDSGAKPAKLPEQQAVTVLIEGVTEALAERLLHGLALSREPADRPPHSARIGRLARQGVAEIEVMLAALGYQRAQVRLADSAGSIETPVTRYLIDPGEPILYRDFEWTLLEPAETDPALQAAERTAREVLRPGSIVDQEQYEQQKSHLLQVAKERGYFAARFIDHEIVIDPLRYEAHGRLVFEPGPRSHFGDITVGESHLDPGLVRRMIRIDTEQPYLNRTLLLQEQALMDSDYFASVSLAAAVPEAAAGTTVPVTVVTTPRDRHRYQAGAGITTDIGPRLSLGWLNRYVNRRGHRLNVEAAAAPVQSSVETEYRIPIRNPLQDSLQLRSGWSWTDSESRESELIETAIERSVARGPWREGISLRALQERFDTGDDEGRSFLLVPGIRWERLWNDRPQAPRRGYRVALGIHGSAETLLSDADFLQGTVSLSYLHALGERSRLLLRGDLGATATSDFDDLPTSYRFFAGGDRSLRGFDFESLGPENADGDVIGGRYLAVGSVEVDRRLGASWGGALFYDVGGAFNNRQQPVEHAVGTGLRLFTPIGTLRLDLAAAISRSGAPWRVHLSIGPDL